MSTDRTPKALVFGSYAYAWQQFRRHFLYLFLIGIIVAVATSPTAVIGEPNPDRLPPSLLLQLLVAAYSLLILPVIKYGANLLNLRYMRNEVADIKEMFEGFRSNYLNIVLANLMVFAIVAMGFLLLIIPGIVFACRLAFVPYLVMDKGLEPVAAVEKSWNMTRGHGFRIFGMFLLAIPIIIIGFLLLFVGVFFATIWISCAFASLYYAVDLEEQKALDANGTA
jgi:uncharacterized membrane protein